jgi:hypothetical protein
MEENLLEIESNPAVYSFAGGLPGLFTMDRQSSVVPAQAGPHAEAQDSVQMKPC